MTKKQYLHITAALLISLFIYLFYRTERTVVNEIIIQLLGLTTYFNLKSAIVTGVPLHNTIIYSLPEGLWIYCITITSKPYYILLGRRRLDGIFIPLIYCLSLELLQLAHITNGRFDYMDILFFVVFWLLAAYPLPGKTGTQPLTNKLNLNNAICYVSYGIVYLAHVIR